MGQQGDPDRSPADSNVNTIAGNVSGNAVQARTIYGASTPGICISGAQPVSPTSLTSQISWEPWHTTNGNGRPGRVSSAIPMRYRLVGRGVVIGFISWIEAGSTLGIVYGLFTIIVGGLAGGLFEASASMDLTKATAPSAVFARDRSTFLVSLALAIPVGLSIGFGTALARPNPLNGPHYGFGYGIGVGIACMIASGLGFASCQATWGGFTLARWWLAATGRRPLRLMTFLHDAHVNRGVLRQVGAVYQFRHAELQRRLADRPDVPLGEQ